MWQKIRRLETVKANFPFFQTYFWSEFLLCKAMNNNNKTWKNNEKSLFYKKCVFLELYFIYFLLC